MCCSNRNWKLTPTEQRLLLQTERICTAEFPQVSVNTSCVRRTIEIRYWNDQWIFMTFCGCIGRGTTVNIQLNSAGHYICVCCCKPRQLQIFAQLHSGSFSLWLTLVRFGRCLHSMTSFHLFTIIVILIHRYSISAVLRWQKLPCLTAFSVCLQNAAVK